MQLVDVKGSSWFGRRDPRVKIGWMFLLSAVVVYAHNIALIGVLLATNLIVWILAQQALLLSKTTLRLIPYLLFLFCIQLIVVWISRHQFLTPEALYQAALAVLRFYIMLTSAVLFFQTTEFWELMAAFRSVKWKRMPNIWNQAVETFGFIIATAYQMVPLILKELETIVLAQRARGIDIRSGNRFQQVKKLVRMGVPLFGQTIELVKNTSIAVLNYGYSPWRERTQFRNIRCNLADYCFISGFVAVGAAASFLLR
jgi:energy-coupling factor transport system permease protein